MLQAEVLDALQTFDKLFPINGGWFAEPTTSHARLAKLVPMPFQGIGAFHRLQRYGFDLYSDFGYTDLTATDLARWHTRGAQLLNKAKR